jgi:predicted TIM-barrel fold metal-dependent hydrolase
MAIIDADTHIDETEDTWGFMDPSEHELKPYTGYPPNLDPNRPPTRYWMVDGHRQPRFIRDDKRSGTTVQMRELLDVPARIQAMDELGTEVQVIYPTLFLVEATERPEVELAIRRSYNRWLGDRCMQSQGRLRWVCLPPTMYMDKALEEIRRAKDNGACGILKKGDCEAGKWPNDEYFFPLYEEAQKLNMPICFHVGTGVPAFPPAKEFSYSRFIRIGVPVIHACHSLLLHKIPPKFPALRWGVIEAGATWLPYILYDLRRRIGRLNDGLQASDVEGDMLKRNNIYVTCQVDEDLPYLLNFIGEDNLLMGSDFTHADASMELEFPRLLQERADRGEIPQSAVRKITYDNPHTFYGL